MKRLLILLILLFALPAYAQQCSEDTPCPELARLSPAMMGSVPVVVGGDTSPAIRLPTGDTAVGGYDDDGVASSGTDKFALVDDPIGANDGAATYVGMADSVARQLFTFAPFAVPAGSTITGLTVSGYFIETAGGISVRLYIRINGTNYYAATTHAVGGSYELLTTDFTSTNPATSSTWTVDEINGIGTYGLDEFGFGGYGIIAGETFNCTQIYITVTFT